QTEGGRAPLVGTRVEDLYRNVARGEVFLHAVAPALFIMNANHTAATGSIQREGVLSRFLHAQRAFVSKRVLIRQYRRSGGQRRRVAAGQFLQLAEVRFIADGTCIRDVLQ